MEGSCRQPDAAGLRRAVRVRPRARGARWSFLTLALALAACGGGGQPVPSAQPFADPGYVDAGDWRLHYAFTPTRELPPSVAMRYGIPQRRELALLTVSLAPRDPAAAERGGEATVEASAVSLTGERRTLALAPQADAGGRTWIATVAIRHRVPLTIEIRARAAPGLPELRVRFTRELRLD